MALPPIISNLPILKLFRGDDASAPSRAKTDVPQSPSGGGALPRDVVEVSDAALQKLNQSGIRTEAQARQTAADARDDLSAYPDLSLGVGTQEDGA